jgi:hypothetical protein
MKASIALPVEPLVTLKESPTPRLMASTCRLSYTDHATECRMPALKAVAKGRPRAPKGNKQMLCILDQDVIKQIKMAALDDVPMSHAVEEAIRDGLVRRAKGAKSRQQPD